ncbi:MAG TPA: protein phosphatase, partial [Pseudomonas sp.]|nr:protein phosphatase [Pseudomonas sp.]
MSATANLAYSWRSAARTDTGKVRARNEDAFLDLPEQGLWVVADGMGGHHNGALASRLIVEQLAALPEGSMAERLVALRRCLHDLNRRLGQELTVTADRPDPVIGSTVVALLMEADRAACVWAGDSRCYLWRR